MGYSHLPKDQIVDDMKKLLDDMEVQLRYIKKHFNGVFAYPTDFRARIEVLKANTMASAELHRRYMEMLAALVTKVEEGE
jgi:hypothetical protein